MSPLQREAGIYQEKLLTLQGKYVPRFIGLFGWTAPDGTTGFECLITTWEGDTLDEEPYTRDVAYRSRILDALLAIHRAGVEHCDLEELSRNILMKDTGEVFVIDFAESKEHQCGLPSDYQFQFYTPLPRLGNFPCSELHDIAQQLDVWYPGEFRNCAVH
ncbi:hypothetical protein C8Q79DRAFT_915667 [Trametes meyenii]|nr:hypothetical protein C8Q79DRAFT_915667 [Trametes meyenii]